VSLRAELSPQARAQIATINLWWAENRPATPTLVAAEFETAIQQITTSPESGRLHDRRRKVPDMNALKTAMSTPSAAEAMAHDGVLAETLVLLVEA
jgi:plasmid stabilization system protein ParE